MKSNLKLKQEVSVNLYPNESELLEADPIWNAVDTLITTDCFTDKNLMKKGLNTLPWKWAIVSIECVDFPTPYTIIGKDKSKLYKSNDDEFILNHHDCSLITANFYLNNLKSIASKWNQMNSSLNPLSALFMRRGIAEIEKIEYLILSDVLTQHAESIAIDRLKIYN